MLQWSSYLYKHCWRYGESNDSVNCILLENIYKEIPINVSLLTTPVKDAPSISKAFTISKLEKAAKIQLKQAILRDVKQQLPNEAKEKGNFDEFLRSLYHQISSLKSEIWFLRERVTEKPCHLNTAQIKLLWMEK